jgi:hypothetical protein
MLTFVYVLMTEMLTGFSGVAPPTDNELRAKGLGRLSPPADVQLAISMSRAVRSQALPHPASSVVDQPQTLPSIAASTDSDGDSPVGTTPTPSPMKNSYSLGENLPKGVAWRYVNILDDSQKSGDNA